MANRTLPDEPLAYETHGEGIPVVFLHGLTFDRRSWGPIITRLSAGVRSIAIDLPGHGGSPGPACGLEQLAGRLPTPSTLSAESTRPSWSATPCQARWQ